MNYIEALTSFVPLTRQEEIEKQMMIEFIHSSKQNPTSRDSLCAHFTASSLIFNADFTKILMVYHSIYHSYSWTGGHVDQEEDFLEVAYREAQEETGLTNIIRLSDSIISLEILPVPFHIKREKPVGVHLHLNATYAFQYLDETAPLTICVGENTDVKWILIDELDEYCSEKEMLPVYHKIIERVIKMRAY